MVFSLGLTKITDIKTLRSYIVRTSEEVIINTFLVDPKILENDLKHREKYLLENNIEDKGVILYNNKNDILNKYHNFDKIEKKYNINTINAEDNHIKGIFGINGKKNINVRALFGSANYTKNKKKELCIYQSTYFDPNSIKNKKFSNYSVISGISKEIENELTNSDVDCNRFNKISNMSRKPIEIYNAKNYGEIIKEEINKIKNYDGVTKVEIVSQKINNNLIKELFSNINKESYKLTLKELGHTKRIIFYFPDGSISFGFGSSNFSKNGLGLTNSKVKESNIFISLNKDEVNIFNNPHFDPLNCNKRQIFLRLNKSINRIKNDINRTLNSKTQELKEIIKLEENLINVIKSLEKLNKDKYDTHEKITSAIEQSKEHYLNMINIFNNTYEKIKDKNLKKDINMCKNEINFRCTLIDHFLKINDSLKNNEIIQFIENEEKIINLGKKKNSKKIKNEDPYNKKLIFESVCYDQINENLY